MIVNAGALVLFFGEFNQNVKEAAAFALKKYS